MEKISPLIYACMFGVGCAHQMTWERYLSEPQLVANHAHNPSEHWSNARTVRAHDGAKMKYGLVYFREEPQPFTGTVRAYYPDGELASELVVARGKIISGLCKSPDGTVASRLSQGTGQLKTFHLSGIIKTITEIKDSNLTRVRVFNKHGIELVNVRDGGFTRLAPFWWEPASISN